MRQDAHRPAEIKTEEYEFVANLVPIEHVLDFGDLDILRADREFIRNHMARTGGNYSTHEHGGTCHCCGAFAKYMSVFYHAKTNTYIKLGWICSEKMEMGDSSQFKTIKRAIQNAREAHAGKMKAKLILEDNSLLEAWKLYEQNKYFEHNEENIVTDIVGKLVRYGSLSDKQIAFVKSLLNKIANRAEIEAKRAEEKAAMIANRKSMLPGERIKLSGRVVKTELGTPYAYHAPAPLRVTLIDENYGMLWFQSTSQAMSEIKKGDTILGTMTVKTVLDSIAFGSRVKVEQIQKAA